MGNPLVFDTTIDKFVRRSGKTRRQVAEATRISPATLLKARALDPGRGRLHWTSLVLIGIQMGIFVTGEWVDENDPRLRKLARGLVSARGKGAPHYADLPVAPCRLRLVS